MSRLSVSCIFRVFIGGKSDRFLKYTAKMAVLLIFQQAFGAIKPCPWILPASFRAVSNENPTRERPVPVPSLSSFRWCRSLHFHQHHPTKAQVGARFPGIVHRNGEDMTAGRESARDREAVDHPIVFILLCDHRREKVEVGACREVVPQDLFSVQINNDRIVSLAAYFEAGVWLVRGEAVPEIGAVAVILICG